MPPKAKFKKQQIVDASVLIFQDEGIEKLTSRNLVKKLDIFECPISTFFPSIADVEATMLEKAKNIYEGYVEKELAQNPLFHGVG